VKKRFEEMQTYLGRDTEGLKKLKLLKDDVNELRTRLAAAKEQLEQAIAIKDAARERADAAEAELATALAETSRVKQLATAEVHSVRAELASVQDAWRELTEACELDTHEATEAEWVQQVRNTLFRLKRQFPRCPRVRRVVCIFGQSSVPVFSLEELIPNWTKASLATLGALVAIWSLRAGGVCITDHGGGFNNAATTRKRLYGDLGLGRELCVWTMTGTRDISNTMNSYIADCRARGMTEDEVVESLIVKTKFDAQDGEAAAI